MQESEEEEGKRLAVNRRVEEKESNSLSAQSPANPSFQTRRRSTQLFLPSTTLIPTSIFQPPPQDTKTTSYSDLGSFLQHVVNLDFPSPDESSPWDLLDGDLEELERESEAWWWCWRWSGGEESEKSEERVREGVRRQADDEGGELLRKRSR